ncbi:MAG TPA: response regulator [Acidimicrobiia bacterium]|nr:response regulator [Acidimicrobiia bacterium]
MTGDPQTLTKRVLICDDEPEIRDLYRFAFETEGFSVAVAVDGLDGIEKAREVQPNLVVLDLAMPRCDGMAALPRILAVAPHACVIIVTAYSAIEAFSAGRRLGARACFQKERFIPQIPSLLDRFCQEHQTAGLTGPASPRSRSL